MTSTLAGTNATAQLGVGATGADVTDWFQQQLLAALADPLRNLPKAFLTYIADYVASSGFNLPIGQVVGYQRDTNQFGLTPGMGPDITAAASITVSHWSHVCTGATTINNIVGGAPGAFVTLVNTLGGTLSISSVGNIFATSATGTRTVPAHSAVHLVYNHIDLTWYVAGVGS